MWTLKLQLLTAMSTALCQEGQGCSAGKLTWIVIEMLLGHRMEDSIEAEI